MKIAVYCSAVQTLDPAYYAAGEAFGRLMAARGHGLVYGGYSRGVMGAVARGVAAGGGSVTAVVPAVFAGLDGGHPGQARVIHTQTMHERKAVMEREADVLAVLPGGIGTLDEFFEAYVLQTLGEMHKPLAVYNWNGCYDALAALLDDITDRGLLPAANRAAVPFFTAPEPMLDWLEEKKMG